MIISISAPARAARGGGFGFPDVLADQEADAHARDLDDRRLVAGPEIALLVEHRVVRQRLLVIRDFDLAVAQKTRRVVDLALRVRMTDVDRDAVRVARERVDLARACAQKTSGAAADLRADSRRSRARETRPAPRRLRAPRRRQLRACGPHSPRRRPPGNPSGRARNEGSALRRVR